MASPLNREVESSPRLDRRDQEGIGASPGAVAHLMALLKKGVSVHQAGRLSDAEAVCQEILKSYPSDFHALQLLGVIHCQWGNYEETIRYIELALRINPNAASAHSTRGNALQGLKHLEPALASYDRAVSLKPDFAEAFNNRGNVLKALKRLEEAIASYDRAITIKPVYPRAFYNRGVALMQLRRFDDALASYDQAVALKPDFAEVFNNRGIALHALGRLEEALASYERAIALNPSSAEAFYNRGITLKELERFEGALASFDEAVALKPNYAEALNNRGNTFKELKRQDEALASYDRAVALKPDYAEAFNNRGNTLMDRKQLEEALASYDRAVALKPDYAEALTNRALCRLFVGRYAEGWTDYEWRWHATQVPSKCPNFINWEGEALEGRRLLVFTEQGLGDIIQFARYLPLLAQPLLQLTFLTNPKLTRLLRPLTSGIEVTSALGPERKFDFQCALMSLPHLLGTDLASIPNSVPYLRAEDALIARWKIRIGERGFKIGIVWQGNPQGTIDQGRSIPLREYFVLGRLPGVRLISLQKGHGLDQLAEVPNDVTIETLGEDFDNGLDAFVDTAAVMGNLDLIIASDTAIAHLAGALGTRTWVVLKYVPHWVWMLDREDSLWYPTVRLFRQSNPNDWTSVFLHVEKELWRLMRTVA